MLRDLGVDVPSSRVQPVWIEINNGTDDRPGMLNAGTDPDFFPPLKVLATPTEPVTDFADLPGLRKALESLPHAVTTADGSGGPLNMVLVGSIEDIAAAGARRGYRRRMTAEDAAFKVFVAQAARPLGGRFASAADRSRMSPEVDENRNVFVQSYMYSGGLEAVGFLAPVDTVPRETPRALADGSHYFTDGVRAVRFFSVRPLTCGDVRRLDWEPLPKRAEDSAGTGSAN